MSKLVTWRRWCCKIEEEILIPYKFNKLVAESYFDIIKPHLDAGRPATFHNWCSDNYAISILLALRKLTDNDPRVYSVRRLVGDIQANNRCIRRETYIRRYPSHFRCLAEENWTKNISEKLDYLPKKIPSAHLDEIKLISERMNGITNRFVAHQNRAKNKKYTIHFDDVYAAIKRLISIAALYSDLVGNAIPDDDSNVSDPTNWESIFEVPWRVR
ncbi:hypothetical protein FT643_08855 [Ketobacter sp. MCCC 1A13808]|uniref:AbiU2 domain-containing protein n=1 Tax=Ketobacter sp. MCCC 1A13808 TaxID=2602738 RepID=UPI0012EC7B86|nr:hypothetical protein [Ketobacter sp. MCCC 1A13808]MVF12254.1 hypothetical protein [Ketobacter sp. MCCC 1A13808]